MSVNFSYCLFCFRKKKEMSVKEKLELIVQLLQNDLQACDLKCSIFISAALSFKRDFLMVPFPLSYLGTTNIKDFDKLVSFCYLKRIRNYVFQ